MQKRERRLTALLLGCLALVSAAVTAWVCLKEQPEKIVAFETRFLNVSEMGFEAAEGLAVEALPDALTLRWETGEGGERSAASVAMPLEPGAREATLTVYASGAQNGLAKARWGYQVWLEAESLDAEGELVTSACMELALESDKERKRPYTLAFQPGGEACSIRVRIRVTPLDGSVASGSLTISNWEVFVR